MEPDNPDGTPPPPDQPTTSSDDSNPQPTTSGGESSGTQVGTPGQADGGAEGPTQPPPTIWDSPFVQDYEDDESSAPLFVDDEDDTVCLGSVQQNVTWALKKLLHGLSVIIIQ